MVDLVKEVTDMAGFILNDMDMTPYEASRIAVEIQRNRLLIKAFVISENRPSALEAIAMELGAANDNYTIKDALYKLKSDE